MMTAAETWESPPSTGEVMTSDVDETAEEAWTRGSGLWMMRRAQPDHRAGTRVPVEKRRKFIETLARSC